MVTPTVAAARSSAPTAVPQADPRTDTLDVVGKIPFPPSYNVATGQKWSNQPTPMLVDPVHSLGFAVGMLPADDGMNYEENFRVAMYDLETLKLLDTASPPMGITDPLEQTLSWAIDPKRGQIFTFKPATGGVLRCQGGVVRDHTYFYERKDGRWQFRMEGSQGWPDRPSGRYPQRMPCGGPLGVHPDAGAVYTDPVTGDSKLYLTGVFVPDEAVRDPATWKVPPVVKPDPNRSAGSSLVVSQLDLDTLAEAPAEAVDWQIDLHKYGCGRRVTFFVGRAGPNVYTYCHDHSGENRYSPLGAQGYVVRIPLDSEDMPRPTGCLPDDVRSSVPDEEAQEALPCELVNPSHLSDQAAAAGAPPLYDEVLNAEVRRIPTLPGFTQPFLDPATGRVLLLTDDPVNGSAVWVLDAIAERFIGVMTPGDAPPRQRQRRPGEPDPPGPTGAGFHSKLGRGYVYAVDGIVVASGRQDPPMAGTLHRVLSRTTHPLQRKPGDFRNRPLIAVAPELDRLFLPVAGEGYFVVEDGTLDPPPPPGDDLDRFTTQVDEQPGVTEENTSSEAEASGLHIVMAGGTSNVVNPVNPLCNPPTFASGAPGLQASEGDPNADPGDDPPIFNTGYHLNVLVEDNSERAIFNGSCLAERVVSRGNRDFALGYATTNAGTSTGVEAEGQGVAFSPSDSASDHDVRNAGECYRGSAHASTTDAADHLSSFSDEEGNDSTTTTTTSTTTTTTQPGPFDAYRRACHEPQNGIREHDGGRAPDLGTGTQGRDGSGFPAPQARCTDSNPDDRRDAAGTDTADGGVFHAVARCDGSRILGRATTSSVGLAVPDASDPTITVGQITSTVDTRRTPEDGVVSIAEARASDVRIGPLHIGIVWSKATSKAHGRTDTAHGELKRAWCDVSVNGEQRFEGCRDPESDDVQSIVDAFNQTSQKVRLSVPEGHEEGTPGGYQAVVMKDPSVAAADQTVNEDDSLTVSGLQAVAYNDNVGGRSRVILQFAGVRSESTYGIVLLPQFSTPEFGPFSGFTTGGPTSFASLPINQPVYGVEARPPRFAEQPIVNDRAAPPESIFTPATRNPVLAALQALEWLRQHPREAALLFLVFSILGLPVYLVARRRAFERALLE